MPHPSIVCPSPNPSVKLHAPREDGGLLIEPGLANAAELAMHNRQNLSADQTDVQGRSLGELRRWTRDNVLRAAEQFTSHLLGEVVPTSADEPLYVTGHQPTFFHAGVWAKNFAVGNLARRSGGIGLNLLIDNDVLSARHVRVPTGDRFHPQLSTVAVDAESPAQPWEDADVLDETLFRTFDRRISDAMRLWRIDPLIEEIWPNAVDHLSRSNRLGECLAACRTRLERRWGLSNLELPLSRLCSLDPFLWFAGHLLAHLPRFHEIHNEVLSEYRQRNRVRSQTHPVPDLGRDADWLEAPFWIWRAGERQRRRLFAKQVAREVWLSDGEGVVAKLRLAPDMDACCAVEGLRDLEAQRFRVRTRALTTTLFARLCLADLFVHGIGGAKYDEMTDGIMARFFDRPAPAFMTVTATKQLPLAEPFDVDPADESRLLSLLRDLRYNADRHGGPAGDAKFARLVSEKRKLIDDQHAAVSESGLTRRQRRARSRNNFQRYIRLQTVNRFLAEHSADNRTAVMQELDEVRRQLSANRVLQSREYAFCLFPAERLRPFLAQLGENSGSDSRSTMC